MRSVKLVRHGESVYNRKGLIQGQRDIELSEKGIKQAKELSTELSFDAIYSSELERARHTAEIVADQSGEVLEREELNERSLGELEGERSEIWDEVGEDDPGWKPEGGESLIDHMERVSGLLQELERIDEEEVLVVAHGGTIRAIISEILGCRSRELWRMKVGNCSITGLSYDEQEGWTVDYINRTLS